MGKTTFIFGLLLACLAPSAVARTPDYYKCSHREGGEWNYGRVPEVCSANAFGDDRVVTSDFGTLVFQDSVARAGERSRYVTEMNSVIREAAQYYIRRRKPAVSEEELAQWTLAIQLVAAQESRMSHYRRTSDRRLKMVRGDVGHGHGLMQIDDRAHFDAISRGVAWNVITNLTYAMDIYYQQWERAPSQSCVNGPRDWKARIRSAWAAYNGGPGSICRWTNPRSVWAQNDRHFLEMYEARSWRAFVTDDRKAASVDVPCLIENRQTCPVPGQELSLRNGKLYELSDKSRCAYLSNQLHCVPDPRDVVCLKALGQVDVADITPLANAGATRLVREDRHALCRRYDATLLPVGGYLRTRRALNLRATPGGGLQGSVPAETVLQIQDFEIRNAPENDRYYQVEHQGRKGYIYGGTQANHSDWAVSAPAPVQPPSDVARVGDIVEIVPSGGINVRRTPGGTLMGAVPKGSRQRVLEVVTQGRNNEVYYLIMSGAGRGYIYSGTLLPSSTIPLWTKVVR